jgi:hypothetical protein
MIPTQEMTAYPTFGDNSARVQPDAGKYAAGFQPGDVVPAEWFNWLLNRGSSATTKLNAGTLSMEQEINNVLSAGNQVPDATVTNQLLTAISYIINQVRLDEQQRPAVGVPTLWLGPKPTWALDFGNGASTQYLWANYPKLNNDKFKDILSTLSSAGWMTAHDNTGFYVPDLRGIVPIGYGLNAKRITETLNGGNSVGAFSDSQNKQHNHGITKGGTNSSGFTGNAINGEIKRPGSGTYSGVPMCNSSNFSTSGALYIITRTTSQAYDINSESGSRPVGIGFSATPSGTVSVTVNNAGANGQASKPATIGCMWIVRFD